MDYYPTILDITGVSGDADHNASMDGVSLVPLLRDPATTLDRRLFWHYPHYHAGGDGPYSAVRDGSWRLIEFHEDNQLALYNLAEDVGETTNLVEQHADKTRELHQQLRDWRRQVKAQMPTPNPDHDPGRATRVGRASRNKQ